MVTQDHEHKEEPEADGRHAKKVYRDNALGVVAQESLPTLAWWATAPHHVLGHRRLRNFDAELWQLPTIMRCAYSGLARLISRMKHRGSLEIGGRPPLEREFQRQ
jgi:hypothetical protein